MSYISPPWESGRPIQRVESENPEGDGEWGVRLTGASVPISSRCRGGREVTTNQKVPLVCKRTRGEVVQSIPGKDPSGDTVDTNWQTRTHRGSSDSEDLEVLFGLRLRLDLPCPLTNKLRDLMYPLTGSDPVRVGLWGPSRSRNQVLNTPPKCSRTLKCTPGVILERRSYNRRNP